MKSSVKKQREKHKQTFIIDFTQFVFYDIGICIWLHLRYRLQVQSFILHYLSQNVLSKKLDFVHEKFVKVKESKRNFEVFQCVIWYSFSSLARFIKNSVWRDLRLGHSFQFAIFSVVSYLRPILVAWFPFFLPLESKICALGK